MRKITIVGAGQAGLQLGLGLLEAGYHVTLVSNRTGEQIRAGRVMSSQCMFGGALRTESDLKLDFWSDSGQCPPVEGIAFTVPGPDGAKALHWSARLDAEARSVDQRVKIPAWMDEFTRRGGELTIADAGVDDLERYAAESDLVVVAAGKGQIASLFARDERKSTYDAPQRALALTYVTGLTPRPVHSAVCFNLIPGVGEYFVFPALTTTGPCEIMVFEGVPGGPMDCWQDVSTPAEHLARSKEILAQFLPWEAERAADAQLTDDNGILAGRFAPTVRQPVATLPSGRVVLGIADVVVLNDPITGQGSNSAAKAAASCLDSIVEHGTAAFDATWMQGAFDRYWAYASHVTGWTNAMLAPPAPHAFELLGAASELPAIASRFVNGFDDPTDFARWFMDPELAGRYLRQAQAS